MKTFNPLFIEVTEMGIGWAYCPVCSKRFEGSYFPDTGVNTAVCAVEKHLLLKHNKKLENYEIKDAIYPNDYINVRDPKMHVKGVTGNTWLEGSGTLYCVCGWYCNVTISYKNNALHIEIKEYSDIITKNIINTEKLEIPLNTYSDNVVNNIWQGLKQKLIQQHKHL